MTPAPPRGLGHHWLWPTLRSGEAALWAGWWVLPHGRGFLPICKPYARGVRAHILKAWRKVVPVPTGISYGCDVSHDVPVVPCSSERGTASARSWALYSAAGACLRRDRVLFWRGRTRAASATKNLPATYVCKRIRIAIVTTDCSTSTYIHICAERSLTQIVLLKDSRAYG